MSTFVFRASRPRLAGIPAVAVVGMTLIAVGCDSPPPVAPFVAHTEGPQFDTEVAPSNERIERIPLDFAFPLDCDGETITVHVLGFLQFRTFDRDGSRNVEVFMINIAATYTNSAGETFVWREVGIDHFTIDQDGSLLRAVIGRAGVEFGTIGRVVVNLSTGEVEFIAGNDVGRTDANACAALT